MGFFTGEQPHTAVTAIINRIIENHSGTSDDGTIELELPELLEAIQIQRSGATEAARAIRKKLKYGSTKEKSNGLQIFELLVANGGKKLSPLYNDSKLLDRFKMLILDKTTNAQLKRQALLMVVGWADEYEGNVTYKGLTDLTKELPMNKYVRKKNKKRQTDFMNDEADDTTPFEVMGGGTLTQPGRGDDTADEDDSGRSSPVSSPRSGRERPAKKSQIKTNQQINREYKIPRINYVKERPKIHQLIADSTASSTKLENSLQSLKPNENPIVNKKCYENFVSCRDTRRKLLRYLQLVDHEEFLGSLIHANEELIAALQKYSTLAEKFVDDDEDEDDDDNDDDDEDESVYTRTEYSSSDDEDGQVSNLSEAVDNFTIPKRAAPPIPPKSPGLRSPPPIKKTAAVVQDFDDEDDPFGDSKKTEFPARWS